MREEVDWGVKHRMLGAGGEVRVDWRAAVLDDAVVPLAPQREELLLQRKLYKQAAAPLRKELSATGKVADAERRAVAEGWQAESQLDEVNAKLDELGLSEPTVTRAQQAAQEQVADLSKSREQVARELYDEVQQLRNADGLARERFADVSESAEALQMGAWLNAGARARVDAEVEGLKAVAKKLAKEPKRSNLSAVADELGDIAKALPDSPELNAALALHAQFTRSLVKVAHAQDNVDWVKVVRDAAKKGDAVDVMMKQAKDGWEEVARAILPESQRVALQKPIADAFKNVEYGFKFDGGLKMVEDLTKFFKTYATATPGFHVRNAMSATFMNYSDGVSTKAMREGMQLWKQYTKDPTTFMAAIETNPRVREAFRAVFGSGAGGQFSAEELATELSTKILHNKWTKLSKRMGGAVEGTVRLGMALDSMDRGMDAFAAMSRITRIHFDYSQLSKLDRYIKLAVPFWTFMSRNLPLQIQQMWTKPRVYSIYNHLQANLGGGNEFEGMPSWMQDKEAVPLGTMPSGSELAFMPDLPHLNAGEQLGLLASGDPRKMMSAMNPMFVAPMEALSGERFRFGTKFENNGDRVEHLFTQMLPPLAHTQRLLGIGRYEGQIPEKAMNFMGIPLQVVGQKERQAVLDRQG